MRLRGHFSIQLLQRWLFRFLSMFCLSFHFPICNMQLYDWLVFFFQLGWWWENCWTRGFCTDSSCLCSCRRYNHCAQSLWCTYNLFTLSTSFSCVWQIHKKPWQVKFFFLASFNCSNFRLLKQNSNCCLMLCPFPVCTRDFPTYYFLVYSSGN